MAESTKVSRNSFSFRERSRALEQLAHSENIFDLCIVGGGITGAAIARDASLRGLKVLLCEKDDFASGTSSRSSKLVHGGVRYLEQYEFKLVMESTRERARLWQLAPHLVKPLAFVFPTFTTSRVPLWKLSAGLWLYDLLALFRAPGLHKRWSKGRTQKEEPALKSDTLVGSIMYWDGATNDALLTLSNIVDASESGATVLARCQVKGVEWNARVQDSADQFHLVKLQDTLKPQSAPLTAKVRCVVAAGGPWTDFLTPDLGLEIGKIMATTRGSHIVVLASRLKCKHAIVLFHPNDGRVLFAIPWEQSTILGTTDLFDSHNPDEAHISSEEIDYLLAAANYYFPSSRLDRRDVQSTWSGLRPLLAPPQNAGASQVSREHHISWHEKGALIICGGKLTTHREMAQEAVDRILTESQSWNHELGQGWCACPTTDRLLPNFGFSEPKNRADINDSLVQLICSTQMVLTLEDFMVRRTSLFYLEAKNGWGLLKSLKTPMCQELSWSDAEWDSQVKKYQKYLEDHLYTPLGTPGPWA